MVATRRPQFVLFGSSIVQMSFNVGGWGAIFADLYARKADVLLRGYNGWNTGMALQVLDKVFPKDELVQPSLVILYFGGNDSTNPHPSGLGAHVPLPEYIENMKKSLSNETRIICLTSPPVNEARIREVFGNELDDQERTNEGCRIYSEKLVELCKEMDVEVINLWTAIQERDDWADSCFTLFSGCMCRDGIHLSAEGSETVVREILKVLKRVDWEPSLYWLKMAPDFAYDSPYYVVGPDGKTTVNLSNRIGTWKTRWLDIWLSMAAGFSDDSPYYSVASDGKTSVNVSDTIAQWEI
ncbi:GDSL esterase/lipase CPRD49-like isoform X2 [Salvia miltiorrhiza]|uniref:GDSL esterase/lipase CPRD49-like isoform X2 n=1 Tax=Salvia miltiorrhiza TaxID=226208 RepID=UPI0025AC0948|nr:GDSL esterase/lipase CPRD49-like isoform X2 [Salvia miltiorrhiza]